MNASRDDFVQDKGYEEIAKKTLEQIFGDGESEKDQLQDRVSATVNNLALWVAEVLINLKHMDKNIPNVPTAERLVTKLGIVVIRNKYGKAIAEIELQRKKIFNLGDQRLLKKADRSSDFEFFETFSTVYRKCSLREWTLGAINDLLVDSLNLHTSTAVELALIAGISILMEWVPRVWVELAEKELKNFEKYLKSQQRRLKIDVLEDE